MNYRWEEIGTANHNLVTHNHDLICEIEGQIPVSAAISLGSVTVIDLWRWRLAYSCSLRLSSWYFRWLCHIQSMPRAKLAGKSSVLTGTSLLRKRTWSRCLCNTERNKYKSFIFESWHHDSETLDQVNTMSPVIGFDYPKVIGIFS